MRELLQRADSFLVYARNETALMGFHGMSEALIQTLEQDGFDCRITEEELTSPPNLYIKNLSGWGLIPIIDGVVDGSGDTKEELYQFLEEYVKEHTK